MEPTEEQIKRFWEYILNTKVSKREGFRGECGEFCDMQENPYSKRHSHKPKALCYLKEARELSEEDRITYQEELDKGLAYFIPSDSNWWEEVPPIDLNNLFKWAVPKFIVYLMGHLTYDRVSATKFLFKEWLKEYIQHGCVDFTLALFWAIYKVIENE